MVRNACLIIPKLQKPRCTVPWNELKLQTHATGFHVGSGGRKSAALSTEITQYEEDAGNHPIASNNGRAVEFERDQ